MVKTLKMPVLGQSVEEVRIITWLKKVGDFVATGETLAEIETDKVATVFESPEAGFVREILAPADSFVAVEAPVLILTDTADESVSPSLVPIREAVSPRARKAAHENGLNLTELVGKGTGVHGRVQAKDVLNFLAAPMTDVPDVPRSVKVSPLARAVADGSGVDLSGVSGSGAGGRIVAEDVRPAPVSVPVATSDARSRTVTLSGLRKRVADNIVKSVARAPHVTLHLSADMGAAMELRKTLLPPIEKKTGVRLSPTDIIVKAVAVALTEHPHMNAHIEGDTITYFDDVHIGLAVSLGEDGLIVPLIRDAHRKGLSEIARARDDIAKRARTGTLLSSDIVDGTFSVSNLGKYGIEGFNPIIAPPQVAILGIGGIADAVVARAGAVSVRPMMTLSLSFDHRATDGAPAAAFLARLKEILETPTLLLL